jgi:predicted kinase
MKILFITIGISGSGKSHYFKNNFMKSFSYLDPISKNSNFNLSNVLVSSDELRKKLTGNINNFSKDGYIWNTVIPNKLQESLNNYDIAILDATNLGNSKLDLIKKLNCSDLYKIALIFKPNLTLSINRVKNDIDSLIDRSNVPTNIIIKQYNNFIKNIMGYKNWDGEWTSKIETDIKNNLKFQFDEFYFL